MRCSGSCLSYRSTLTCKFESFVQLETWLAIDRYHIERRFKPLISPKYLSLQWNAITFRVSIPLIWGCAYFVNHGSSFHSCVSSKVFEFNISEEYTLLILYNKWSEMIGRLLELDTLCVYDNDLQRVLR